MENCTMKGALAWITAGKYNLKNW